MKKFAFFDVETRGLYGDFVLGGVLFEQEVRFFDDKEKMKEYLRELEEGGVILVGHNVIYDFTVLDYKPGSFKSFHDTLLYAKAIGGSLEIEEFKLEFLAEHFKVFSYQTHKDTIRKMLEKGKLVFDLKKYLKEDLEATQKVFEKLQTFFPLGMKVYATDKQLLIYLLDIQKRGLPINKEEAQSLLNKYLVIVRETEEFFKTRYNININSPIQIARKFGLENAQKSTLIKFLFETENDEKRKPIEVIMDYKKKVKLVEFLKRFLKKANGGSRVYGYFHPCGAISGRLSCSDENLLQIPRDLRKIFQTDKYFLIYDFSQIELRLAGQMWKEPLFVRAFQNEEDLHYFTSQKLFQKPEISKEERQIGKIFNFAMLYGAGVQTLYEILLDAGLNYNFETIRNFRYTWLNLYRAIKKHQYEVKTYLETHGKIVVETALGRTILAKKFSDALNFPIQGTGADLLKGVVIKFLRKYPETRIINLVHDELQIECETEEEAKEYAKTIDECLQESWEVLFEDIYVPVKGEWTIQKALEK